MRVLSAVLALAALASGATTEGRKHHHHRHHRHVSTHVEEPAEAPAAEAVKPEAAPAKAEEPKKSEEAKPVAKREEATPVAKKEEATPIPEKDEQKVAPAKKAEEASVEAKMKQLEEDIKKKLPTAEGRILVNSPLPTNFPEIFRRAVCKALKCDEKDVVVVEANAVNAPALVQVPNTVQVVFSAPEDVVKAVEAQVADGASELAGGELAEFLVAAETPEEPNDGSKGINVDTEMPYGELEPFGREDTAGELTNDSIKQSNAMVDQLEKAEVAEERRAVFRALTRLRGAAITSFDGIARSQTGNLDEYALTHQWRKTHPLHHLANEEADVQKWAFPDAADF